MATRRALASIAAISACSALAGGAVGIYLDRLPRATAPAPHVAPTIPNTAPPNPKEQARLDALIAIYRRGHQPLNAGNLEAWGKNRQPAYLAEQALKRDYPLALAAEQAREQQEAGRARESEVDSLVANEQARAAAPSAPR
jgi:hypothetical protein